MTKLDVYSATNAAVSILRQKLEQANRPATQSLNLSLGTLEFSPQRLDAGSLARLLGQAGDVQEQDLLGLSLLLGEDRLELLLGSLELLRSLCLDDETLTSLGNLLGHLNDARALCLLHGPVSAGGL